MEMVAEERPTSRVRGLTRRRRILTGIAVVLVIDFLRFIYSAFPVRSSRVCTCDCRHHVMATGVNMRESCAHGWNFVCWGRGGVSLCRLVGGEVGVWAFGRASERASKVCKVGIVDCCICCYCDSPCVLVRGSFVGNVCAGVCMGRLAIDD